MSNNEMVSVPRDVADDICNGLRITQERAIKELRALLAAPACSLCRDLGDTCIECEKASTVTRLQAEVAEWKKQAAYNQDAALRWLGELDALKAQPQGEPVPLTAVGVLRDDGDGGLAPEWVLEGGTAELWDGATLLIADADPDLCVEDGHCELYRQSPALVAVVLPERLPGDDGVCTESHYASGWNACLDEVKRLNPWL